MSDSASERVRNFFVEEAAECLDALRDELTRQDPDPKTLHTAARKLRGSAQVARFGALAERAGGLEALFKGVIRQGSSWSPLLAEESAEYLAELEDEVAAVREGRVDQDERKPMTDEQNQFDDAAGAGDGPEMVALDEWEYGGDAALTRAASLRGALEDAFVDARPPGAILDELFDLIELART